MLLLVIESVFTNKLLMSHAKLLQNNPRSTDGVGPTFIVEHKIQIQ